MRPVKVGTTDGNIAAVQGVQPSEVVVVNGFDKLQDGVKVSVHNPASSASANASSNGAAGQ
jgi:multidrug efflux system membrane fusion protein